MRYSGKGNLRVNGDYLLDTGVANAELRVRGQTIQQNDMWIAALARQYGFTLATLDTDFTHVSGLRFELW